MLYIFINNKYKRYTDTISEKVTINKRNILSKGDIINK